MVDRPPPPPPGFVLDGAGPSAPPAPPPGFVLDQGPSVIEDVAKAVPSAFARGAAGLVGLPGTVGDLMRGGLQAGMSKGYELVTGGAPSPYSESGVERFFAGPIPELESQLIGGGKMPASGQQLTDALGRATQGATDYQPETKLGKYAATVSEFAPGALALGGGGGAVEKLARYALAPGVASEAAGQATEGTWLEGPARIAGSIAGGVAGGSLFRPKAGKLPTAQEIKNSAGYKDLKEPMKAARLDQASYGNIVRRLGQEAEDFGVVPELHGPVRTILLREAQRADKGGGSLHDLELMRRSFLNAAKSNDPSLRGLAGRMLDTLDEAVEGVADGGLMVAPGQSVDDTIGALKEARSIYRTGAKSGLIERAIDKGGRAASGTENGIRTEFRKLLSNEKVARQFNDVEKQLIEQVANGTFKGNMMRYLGTFGVPTDQGRNWLGSIIGGGAGGTVGKMLGDPTGGIATGAITMAGGTLARKAAENITRNNAQLVEALVKAGPEASQTMLPILEQIETANRMGLLRLFEQSVETAKTPQRRKDFAK